MINRIYCRLTWRFSGVVMLLVTVIFSSVIAQAGEQDENTPKLVYDNLPSKWEVYFVLPDLIEKYQGELINEICLDEDFIQDDIAKGQEKYQTQRVRLQNNRFTQRKLLNGVRDFIVIDEKHLVINTPNTGKTLIKTRYGCRNDALSRAKYIVFSDNQRRSKPSRCMSRRLGLTIYTRYKAGVKSCKISRMYEWNGPTDSMELKTESNKLDSDNTERDE